MINDNEITFILPQEVAAPTEVKPTFPKLRESLPTVEIDPDQIKDVDMHEVGITDSRDPKPLVGTTGLTECIAVVGGGTVNGVPVETLRIGVCAHLTPTDSVARALQVLNTGLKGRYPGKSITLVLGIDTSEAFKLSKVEEAERLLADNPLASDGVSITVRPTRHFQTQMRKLGEGYATLEGVAYDTRSGETVRYAPNKSTIGTDASNLKI